MDQSKIEVSRGLTTISITDSDGSTWPDLADMFLDALRGLGYGLPGDNQAIIEAMREEALNERPQVIV